jgi:hypothetical protein
MNQYLKLSASGINSDSILVLVQNSAQINKWREYLHRNLQVFGSLQIYTYWGFAQAEVTRHWDLAEQALYGTVSTAQPTFITTEIAHYLMSLLVSDYRTTGRLDTVGTPAQLALQIINNMNLAAMSSNQLNEPFLRILRTEMDPERGKVIGEALGVAQEFRKSCLDSRSFDYSLVVETYNTILMSDPGYQESLAGRYQALIVDNIEESVPAQTDLTAIMLQNCISYAAFDPTGGHYRFFGADPDYAWNTLNPLYEISSCEVNPNEKLAEVVTNNIKSRRTIQQCRPEVPRIRMISQDYRSEIVLRLVDHIEALIARGCPPNEIAIIAPVIDRVLDISLSSLLKAKGIPFEAVNRKEILADQEFAQVMVTLAALIEGQTPNVTELARALNLILEVDPIRSNILAKFCFSKGIDASLPPGTLTRVGFAAGRRYDEFREWILEKRQDIAEEGSIFQQLFAEVVSTLIREQDDIVASRQVIKSAIAFEGARQDINVLNEQPFLQSFVNMVRQGTVAAEANRMRRSNPDSVVLSTPLGIFQSSRSFKFQFWLDGSSSLWIPRIASELNNYHLMSKSWDGRWDAAVDMAQRDERTAQSIAGLIMRCTEEIVLLVSEYDSLGREQEGELPELIFESINRN